MKTRRALMSSVNGRGASESDQLLPHIDLEFIDSLSDLDGGMHAAPPDAKLQQQQQHLVFPIGGSTDEDDALKHESHAFLDLAVSAGTANAAALSSSSTSPMKDEPMTGAAGEDKLTVVPPRRAKFSAEVRKARHRDRMQRTRMAEKKDLEVKRGEMEQLEVRLKHSIDGYLSQDHEEAESDAYFESRTDSAQLAVRAVVPAATLQRKYVGLVVQQDQIKRENAQLAVRIFDHQKYEKIVVGELERANEAMLTASATDVLEPPRALTETSAVPTRNGGYWLSFTESEPHLYFEPLSWATCKSATATTYSQMTTLQRGVTRPAAAPSEGFGWKFVYGPLGDRENSVASTKVRMQHQFVKRLAPLALGSREPVTIDSISANMWEILHSSELYSKIYKTDMVSKVLQRVDDHTSVLLRTYPDEHREMRSRFLSLLTRTDERVVDAATGESRRRIVLLLSVLDPDACLKTGTGSSTSTSSSGQATWLRDGMAYVLFTEVGASSSSGDAALEIELEYGGFLDVASEAVQAAVVRNILEALLRLERASTRTEAVLLAAS